MLLKDLFPPTRSIFGIGSFLKLGLYMYVISYVDSSRVQLLRIDGKEYRSNSVSVYSVNSLTRAEMKHLMNPLSDNHDFWDTAEIFTPQEAYQYMLDRL